MIDIIDIDIGDRPWGPSHQALDGPLEDAIEAVQQVVTNGCMTSRRSEDLNGDIYI